MNGKKPSLPKEGVISAINVLKNFPDEKVYFVLADYFFHTDMEISLEALRSSAFRNNKTAVPFLLRMIEGGKSQQKIEALRTLACIDAPHAIETLLKYYSIFKEMELQQTLLQTMSAILPVHEKVLELNRGLLAGNCEDEKLSKLAVRGLVDAEDFSFLNYYLLHAPSAVQYEAFKAMHHSSGKDVAPFLKKLEIEAKNFSDKTKGAFLSVYFLKVQKPNTHYSMNILKEAQREAYETFLILLSENIEQAVSPKGIFRFLLLLPFVGKDVEILVSELVKKLMELAKNKSPGSVNELRSITTVHLDSVFRKVREKHISLRGVTQKDDLVPTLLAHLLEKYSPSSFLIEVQNFFKDREAGNARYLIESLREYVKDGEQSDRNGFRACVPLFLDSDRKLRLKVNTIISKIDPHVSHLLRRLNRLVKAAGFLMIRSQEKRISEIHSFSLDEKITYLEEASTITLCQLASRNIIDEIKQVLGHPSRRINVLKSYIRGAQYLPPESVAEPLFEFLFHSGNTHEVKDLVIGSLCSMDMSKVATVNANMIRAFESKEFTNNQKKKVSDILSRYGDSAFFQPLFRFLSSDDTFTRIHGIKIVREIGRRSREIPVDVLTGKLYSLLEDTDKTVRVETLFTLLTLGDDYAEKVLGDWLGSNDEYVITEMLSRLKETMTQSILSWVLLILKSDKLWVQKSLRDLLSSISQGRFSDQIKNALIAELGESPEESLMKGGSRKEAALKDDRFLHSKIEFKFKREHSQTLTVFFIDMVGYTERSSQYDMTGLMKLVKTFEESVIPSILSYNGQIVKKLGDGILAVFKHPASAAIAALEIQGKINDYNRYTIESEKFQVRMGVHVGSVIWKDNDIFGDVVNTASRMESSAEPGEILLTEDTYRSIRDFVTCDARGEVQIKGKEEAIKAYSPRGIVKDVKALLEIKKSNVNSLLTVEKSGVFEKLKEALFSPRFEIPEWMHQDGKMINVIKSLFTDMAGAASEISHDYHEEYLFKRYLKEKWDETLAKLRRSP